MYAVIRTGGKQYRVAPGDTLRIETAAHKDGDIEFSDVLAFSGEEGKFEQKLDGAKVLASVIDEGRGNKILVFKLKRKKQYKKMQGHRQNYVEVRINEILVNGKSFKDETRAAEHKDAPKKAVKKTPAKAAAPKDKKKKTAAKKK